MAVSARKSRRLLRLCDVGAALREVFVCGGEEWALHRGEKEGRGGSSSSPSREAGGRAFASDTPLPARCGSSACGPRLLCRVRGAGLCAP